MGIGFAVDDDKAFVSVDHVFYVVGNFEEVGVVAGVEGEDKRALHMVTSSSWVITGLRSENLEERLRCSCRALPSIRTFHV